MVRQSTSIRALIFLAGMSIAIAGTASATDSGQTTAPRGNDFAVDWFTVDAGGELFAEDSSGSWQLSGTVAQWDAAPARPQVSGQWEVAGGFWGVTVAPGDTLFKDSYEGN